MRSSSLCANSVGDIAANRFYCILCAFEMTPINGTFPATLEKRPPAFSVDEGGDRLADRVAVSCANGPVDILRGACDGRGKHGNLLSAVGRHVGRRSSGFDDAEPLFRRVGFRPANFCALGDAGPLA